MAWRQGIEWILSLKQQRRPLPSLLSKTFFYGIAEILQSREICCSLKCLHGCEFAEMFVQQQSFKISLRCHLPQLVGYLAIQQYIPLTVSRTKTTANRKTLNVQSAGPNLFDGKRQSHFCVHSYQCCGSKYIDFGSGSILKEKKLKIILQKHNFLLKSVFFKTIRTNSNKMLPKFFLKLVTVSL